MLNRLNETVFIKYLRQCLAPNGCSINPPALGNQTPGAGCGGAGGGLAWLQRSVIFFPLGSYPHSPLLLRGTAMSEIRS